METVCPSCAAPVDSLTSAGPQACPHCGYDLSATLIDPCTSDPAMARLSEDLRDAFGAGAFMLEPSPARGSAEATVLVRSSAGVRDPGQSGSRLDDFELLEVIGRGGMGVVYRARQISLNREVALKVLPPFARRQRAAVARFRRESQAAARLHHTNIVPIYAQGVHEDQFYYAMELIDGQGLDTTLRDDSSVASLTLPRNAPTMRFSDEDAGATAGEPPAALDITRIHRGRGDYRRISRLLAEVADALDHAHRSGVIHRDVKPQNLLLGRDGRLHITDFGLAHLMDQPHLTVTGEIMGTPAYMSPEQIGAVGEIDPRTDIYSLGVTLYELLTLRRPFEGHTREQIMARIAAAEPRAPRTADPRIPRDLETVCLRAIEKEPARRYPTAAALAEDLRRIADERSILTRRATPLSKAAKWVRRHRAASVAFGVALVAFVLAVALGVSAAASREREADQLIASVYDQLIYRDYKNPVHVKERLDQAERLGGDLAQINRLRGLAAMNEPDKRAGLPHAQAAVSQDPDDRESLYLLAWIHWRAEDRRQFDDVFRRAEDAGGATTPAQWFLRALALQNHNPSEAIRSYEQASRMRWEQEHNVFPQATLNLARARNQLMYRTRDITGFEAVERALRELIDHQFYDAYPHYLLSIANRLVGEVYADSEGIRDATAKTYFERALHWAQKGQKVASPDGPNLERTVTAEAEYHESMGDFVAAEEARTRAIDLAPTDLTRCEGYHYRWRLRFWRGELDGALEDLEAHCQCLPEIPDHAGFYPMLVHAEAGRVDEALGLARGIAQHALLDQKAPPDAQALIWSASCLRILGHAEEAQALLKAPAASLSTSTSLWPPQTEQWVEKLYEFAAGRVGFVELLAAASGVDSYWKLTGEAYFHAGAMKLGEGDRAGAMRDFEQAYRCFDDQTRYTYHAQIFRVKWRSDPSWPPWVGATEREN